MGVELARVGVSRPTVISWRDRYRTSGINGLHDEPRPGRPRTIDRPRILAATLTPPPQRLGVTHWSSRLLAAHLKTDQSTVLRTWRHHRVQPWRAETFKFSTDPELITKVTDVVGLYLNPPENAIVLCVDAKSQIQSLDRTQKTLPMQPGKAERRTHDYIRHKIRAFINSWNDRCQPFTWTKTPDQILRKANRQSTSVSVH